MCGSHSSTPSTPLVGTAPTPDWLRYAGDHTALSKQRRGAEWCRERRDQEPDPTLVWPGPRLVHPPPEPSGSRMVSSGTSFAQVAGAILGNESGERTLISGGAALREAPVPG